MVICLFPCVHNGGRGAKIASPSRAVDQTAGRSEPSVANGRTSVRTTGNNSYSNSTRNELRTALSAKASSSQVDESQVVDSRNIPKPPVFDGNGHQQ